MVRLLRIGRHRGALLRALLLLVVCSGAALAAQQPPPAAGDTEPIRIDAVVTDTQGRAILDLRASDFELLESGVSKPLQKVELRTLPRDPDARPIENTAEEQRAARQPGTRVFAFFLDEFHVSPGASTDRVRQAMTEFVDEKLRPQDLAVVMKPLDAVTSIRFTRDRALLHGAIENFAGRKGDYAPRTPFEAEYIGHAPAAVAAARRQIVTAGLRELTMKLGELEADRGVVLLVSEGFPRDTPAPRSRGADLQAVVRASSRFNLSTYAFNPATGADDVAPPVEREAAVATLQWLASQTGGRAIEAEASVSGLARLAHDLEAYYVLSYEPAKPDGRFHPVEVRARRRNLLIHARPGYWAPLGTEWRTMLASASTSMLPLSRRALRRSPAIEAWVGLVRDPEGGARMVVSWAPKSRGVSAPAVVAVKARTVSGTALFDGRLGGVGSGSVAPADSARFQVPPGRVELDMAIYDAQGKSLDTDSRDVDVPDLKSSKGGPVLLAPELVRARTLRDFRSATTNPDAAPSPVRTFARGDRLLIRVPVFDGSGTAVQVSAKVLNEWGQPMRDIDALESTPLEGMSQFSLPLSWLAPGDYLLEVLGTNANGSVRQRVPFTVTS